MKKLSKVNYYSSLIILFLVLSSSASATIGQKIIPSSVIDVFDWFFNVLPFGGDRYVFLKFLIFLLMFTLLQEILRKLPTFGGGKH